MAMTPCTRHPEGCLIDAQGRHSFMERYFPQRSNAERQSQSALARLEAIGDGTEAISNAAIVSTLRFMAKVLAYLVRLQLNELDR